MLLKDRLPLSPDQFVEGNTPANLSMGLDLGGTAPIAEVARRLSLAGAIPDTLSLSHVSLDSKGSSDGHLDHDMSDIEEISGYSPMLCRRASVVDSSDMTGTSPLFIEFIQVGPMD
jgi:hypothetical protein